MREPFGSEKNVTLLRAKRLLQERPVARNLCAGFWGPQRTPTKAVLRVSFCVPTSTKSESTNGCYVDPLGNVLPESKLRRLAMIVGGHKSFMTFMSSRASIHTGRRTYASFA